MKLKSRLELPGLYVFHLYLFHLGIRGKLHNQILVRAFSEFYLKSMKKKT